jgi:hypothetical protein
VDISCKQLKKQAYNTHPHCYSEAGFCNLYRELGFKDSAIFLKELLGIYEAKDFGSLSAIKQIKRLAKDCWK